MFRAVLANFKFDLEIPLLLLLKIWYYSHFRGHKRHLEEKLQIRLGTNVQSHVMFILHLNKRRFRRYSFISFVHVCWFSPSVIILDTTCSLRMTWTAREQLIDRGQAACRPEMYLFVCLSMIHYTFDIFSRKKNMEEKVFDGHGCYFPSKIFWKGKYSIQ